MYAFLSATLVVGCAADSGLDLVVQEEDPVRVGCPCDLKRRYLGWCASVRLRVMQQAPRAIIGGDRSDKPITPSGLGRVVSANALRERRGGWGKKLLSRALPGHEQLPFNHHLLRSEPFLSPAEASQGLRQSLGEVEMHLVISIPLNPLHHRDTDRGTATVRR
ncbi:hypothetical protein B0H13DRAFT_1884759 [Mycena leptocephala]|nr:hypothetical protein B0H13DRAFT_1884759 [Mycena leptocephala]